ncbi:MAG: discoidin domain-containing protein, partial [Oscillospiraceae bacterium]|nr:discoidin domain-containing protein [Oscillospiraceae bacterium]
MPIRKLFCAALALSFLLPALAVPSAASFDWPVGRALPRFGPPAETLDAIDVAGMPFAERLAVSCLQGIVNRARPRIFLVDRDSDTRDSWGDDLGLSYAFLPWRDVLLNYLGEFKGLVIFNPAIAETANVATTVAGVEDVLAVSPALAEEMSAAPYNLPVLVDLREAPITDKLSAYRWMHGYCWERCTRRTICGLAPDGHLPLRDFSVAVRAAVVWLDPKIPEERAVLQLFFNGAEPLECFYTGWWPDEGAGISFASAYGVMTIASDFYLNYTVYSGMPSQLEIPPVPAKPPLEDGRIYVSLNVSDGDNIQYDQGAMKIARLWGSPRRGDVPIGWTFSPAMLDAGPQILNWYYGAATENDALICGPSGLGYSTAAQWPGRAFAQKYGAMTNDYFERANMNVVTVWQKVTASRAEWFMGAMPGLLGITTQFENGKFSPKVRYTRGGKPIVWLGCDVSGSRGSMSYDNGTGNIKQHMAAAAEQGAKGPQFFMAQVDVWHTGVDDLVRLRDELSAQYPGRFIFVRPDHLMMLANEYYAKPFMVSLQKPAADGDGGPAAVTDGTFTTGWQAPAPGRAMLRIDLGESVKLDRYVLKNAETGYFDAGLNSRDWELHISADGEQWATVDRVGGNSGAIAYRNLRGQAARYVRLVVTDAGADGIARVQELEIYGVPAARANDPLVRLRGFFHDLLT